MEDYRGELTETSYMREIQLDFSQCDRNQNMTMGTILTQAAVFAGHDYDARGLTYQVLYDRREVFLLSRLAVKLHHCPRVGDVLQITTWEDGARGAHMQRVYEYRTRAGELCVSLRSDWIMVDPVSRKILRPQTFTARPLRPAPVTVDCPAPKKIALPPEAEELGRRTVRWSDLDGNGHLFSGTYGDVIWDALPAELQPRTPREFYLNYSREATLGQELQLLGHREGDDFRMEGAGPHGPCFTALIRF